MPAPQRSGNPPRGNQPPSYNRPGGQNPPPNQYQESEFINSSYNFVPLANKVVTPDWAELVSHDVPFHDGLSGEIAFELVAHSPLLVGGLQTKATEQRPSEVKPFQTPDGKYAIPGSSIKGMIRAVLEIATFSKMGMVDDKRYGLRDITGKYVAESYASRVRNRVQTGFLRLSKTGEPEIVPCAMARLDHRELEAWWKLPKPVFKKRTAVKTKYEQWQQLCTANRISNPFAIPVTIAGDSVVNIEGSTTGFPVFTGQISDSTDDRQDRSGKWSHGKYRDFVFHSKNEQNAFFVHEVDTAAWRDFLFIHGDEDEKPDMPWSGFWKARFWRKQEIPVFYIRSTNKLQIGLAYMPKLAGDFSIHDMIGHSSKDHLDAQKSDFASLIFGKTSTIPQDTLKGRVWFAMVEAIGNPVCITQPDTILNGPKPTYFPNYIQQQATSPSWKLSGRNPQYATYLETQDHTAPLLRGWKRYPVHPITEIGVQVLQGDQQNNRKIQVRLHTLDTGAKFSGQLHFHNLKPEELGALLWALNFGGNSSCHHGFGMGKAFGFGQVTLQLQNENSAIRSNDLTAIAPNWNECVNKFRAYMDKALGHTWEQTPQIQALLAMADPAQRNKFPGQLKYMVLARIPDPNNPGKKISINEFQDAKRRALVLASYVSATASVSATPPQPRQHAQPAAPIQPVGPIAWKDVVLTYQKNSGIIAANQGENKAFSDAKDKNALLAVLDDATKKKLMNGKLKATITLEPRGGKNWKIIKIELSA